MFDFEIIHFCLTLFLLEFFFHFPLVLQVIDEYDQNVHFVEIDIEEDPEIAEAAGIMGTPCVQFFKSKEMLKYACVIRITPSLSFALL